MASTKYKGFRPQKITIDIPQIGDEPWIEVVLQGLDFDEDGKVIATRDREDRINIRFRDVGTDVVTWIDPVTQMPYTGSIAGVAEAVRKCAIQWIEKKHAMEYDPVVDRAIKPV